MSVCNGDCDCPACDGTNEPTTSDLDQLAEFILIGETDAALTLLHDLFPARAPWPEHAKRRNTDRRAEPARRFA